MILKVSSSSIEVSHLTSVLLAFSLLLMEEGPVA